MKKIKEEIKEPGFWSTLLSFIWKSDEEEENEYEGVSEANKKILKETLENVDHNIMKSTIDVSTKQHSGRMSQLKANVKGTNKTSKMKSEHSNEVQKVKNGEKDISRE